jgi:hypothetical protein
MATVTSQSLKALIKRVEDTEGFQVADLGPRWKISNDAGGRDLFIAKRPPQSNTLKVIHDQLAEIGWDPEAADEARKNGSRARLDADRERNDARLKAAVEEAERLAAAAAEEARRATSNRDAARVLAATAINLGHGHRKALLEIDADFARALLEHNDFFIPNRAANAPVGRCNRPYDRRLEAYYAGQMLRREWHLTHQGIALDIDGKLLDGQHRLGGLVKAAETDPTVTFVTEVTYDLDPATMTAIDIGKGRLKTDALAFRGEANRHLLASTIMMIWRYDNFPLVEWDRTRMSNDQMFEFLDANPGVRDAVRVGGLVRNFTTGSSASAFIYIAGRAYRDAPLDDFMHGLRNTYDTPEGDPRRAFRAFNERVRRANSRRRTDQVEQLALLIKTWNYWLMGRTWKTAVWKITEDFPRPIERD